MFNNIPLKRFKTIKVKTLRNYFGLLVLILETLMTNITHIIYFILFYFFEIKDRTLKIFKTENIEIFGQTKENEFFGCIFKVTYFIKIMPTKRKRVSGLGSIKRRAKQRLKIVRLSDLPENLMAES